ncbi:hypothetical protein [Bradyrhizobium genosp. A]|uniref:hypothetical protein n=1 Tax=Bradyrhizobium genosp. A TaxID=83626 RepID=UPI003CEB46A7
MTINRRTLLGGLAAVAAIPFGLVDAAQPVRLWGPVRRWDDAAPHPYPYYWTHLRRWHRTRWHYDETKNGVPIFRHCDSGLTYLAVETAWYDLFSPGCTVATALQEIRPASGLPWRPGVSSDEVVEIGYVAAMMVWNVGASTMRLRQLFETAAYWDYRLRTPALEAPPLIIEDV